MWDCEQIDNIYGGNIVLLNAYKPGVADGIVFAQGPGSQLNTYITQHYSSEFAGSYLNEDWSDCYVIYVSDSQGWTYYRYRDVVSYEETTSTSNVPPEGYEYYKSEIVIHTETGQHGQNGVSIPWLRVMYVMLKRIHQQERYCTVIRQEKRQRL